MRDINATTWRNGECIDLRSGTAAEIEAYRAGLGSPTLTNIARDGERQYFFADGLILHVHPPDR